MDICKKNRKKTLEITNVFEPCCGVMLAGYVVKHTFVCSEYTEFNISDAENE